MSDLLPHTRSDLAELPCDTEPAAIKEPDRLATPDGRMQTEAPAVADVGHLPRIVYTINSDRPRWRIIHDYALSRNLTVAQIDELVRALPDYGLRSQLGASLAAELIRPRTNVLPFRLRRRG